MSAPDPSTRPDFYEDPRGMEEEADGLSACCSAAMEGRECSLCGGECDSVEVAS